MTGLTFDTHKFITKLTAAKMPPEQAEILSDQYTEILNDRLATKDDLKLLESNLWGKMLWLQIAGILATVSILGFILNN